MTKREIYERVESMLAARRQESKSREEQHREVAVRRVPQIRYLEQELSRTTISLSKQVLSHETDISGVIPEIRAKNLEIQQQIAELLYSAGLPIDYLDTKYFCEECRDTGYHNGARCKCMKTLVQQIIAEEFNRTVSVKLCRFDDFSLHYYKGAERNQMEKILQFCRRYADSFSDSSSNILMVGGTGLGKTHLSLSIAERVIAKGHVVLYGTAQEFFLNIQNEQFGKSTKDVSTLSAIAEADLFIMDDLGAEYESNYHTASFYNILNSRVNAGKPTIINTNIMPKQLVERYGERISSRLLTLFQCLKFAGTDIRQLKLLEKPQE